MYAPPMRSNPVVGVEKKLLVKYSNANVSTSVACPMSHNREGLILLAPRKDGPSKNLLSFSCAFSCERLGKSVGARVFSL
ncbi:hypothetical protein CEXT_553931 [Caerostris extrusa]|uniref:Uncharacterized protein n=1 Tax=Caerostris extrusa TaxID=172846 RepID=A0AAV4PB80_CAEEX|nr:hypothetical protein CEXT_553931 [Caerostris extrusa]